MLRGAIRSQPRGPAEHPQFPSCPPPPHSGGESPWAGCGGQGGSTPRCARSWGLGAPRWSARMWPQWGPGRWGTGNGDRGGQSWVPAAPQKEVLGPGTASAPSGPAIPQPLPWGTRLLLAGCRRRRKSVEGPRRCIFSVLQLIEMKSARDKGEFRKGHRRRFPFPARERVSQRHR